ncbi:MAG: aquaporin family protein [Flammeovirgaceae bacterium]|jgi:glycerol uptake facilitator protein|nr:aquaporin family protein [Flammeovirgaceae bacterium]
MSPYLAEFFGTLLLILLGGGVNAAVSLRKSKSENGGWLMIAIGWGLAVMLAIYAVGSISGAHLNPAVTIALAINGSFASSLVVGYIVAQFIGAIVGATLVWLHYLPHWKETVDPAAKLGVFCNAPAIRNTFTNLISEIIATMVLIMALLFIGANEFTKGLNPIVVGLLIISIGLSLGGTTGFAINPARDLGPRIAHFVLPIHGKGKSDWSYAWIPVIGPVIGGILGALLYRTLFV